VLGEEGEHLLDLHDLFGRAAKEGEEGFAEGLVKNAEVGVGVEAAGEMRVAAPGELVDCLSLGWGEAEVVGEGGGKCGGLVSGAAPFERGWSIERESSSDIGWRGDVGRKARPTGWRGDVGRIV